MENERYVSLDAIRGFAVMGILLMNIVAFAMPETAYFNPAAYGGTGTADLISWATMFVLVDSKMRSLFSMLFGASMLLVYERAQDKDGNGAQVHLKRMLWLLLFGLIHFYFIWFGDILFLYAGCGIVGLFLLNKDEGQLKRLATWLISANLILFGSMIIIFWIIAFVTSQPGADAYLIKSHSELMADIGNPTLSAAAKDVALHLGTYAQIIWDRLSNKTFDPLWGFASSALETLGLMALGMMFIRNGFLTGEWDEARYAKTMKRAYLIGIPPSIGLAIWSWLSGFDPVVVLGNMMAWSTPFRIAVMIGHAALFMLITKRFARSEWMARIVATGQAAFSNYLGTSILMTFLFYGYGLGWYGQISRVEAYAVVPVVWLLMLLWSKPWLDRFRYGPLEWLWRSLARGELQTMTR